MDSDIFYKKYLKYKAKYLELMGGWREKMRVAAANNRIKEQCRSNKQLKYKNLYGGNKIEFKFIELNNLTYKEQESQLEEIDVLLKKTDTYTNDSNFFKKNVFRYMPESIVLYMLYGEQIIGIIVGEIDVDNYLNISEVEIRTTYLNQEYRKIGISGRILLTEYINKVTLKHANINGFKLFNAGGKQSCFLYYKVFTELGYKIDPSNIDCNVKYFINMKFSKNALR